MLPDPRKGADGKIEEAIERDNHAISRIITDIIARNKRLERPIWTPFGLRRPLPCFLDSARTPNSTLNPNVESARFSVCGLRSGTSHASAHARGRMAWSDAP